MKEWEGRKKTKRKKVKRKKIKRIGRDDAKSYKKKRVKKV
jgi:hypothetical protein